MLQLKSVRIVVNIFGSKNITNFTTKSKAEDLLLLSTKNTGILPEQTQTKPWETFELIWTKPSETSSFEKFWSYKIMKGC